MVLSRDLKVDAMHVAPTMNASLMEVAFSLSVKLAKASFTYLKTAKTKSGLDKPTTNIYIYTYFSKQTYRCSRRVKSGCFNISRSSFTSSAELLLPLRVYGKIALEIFLTLPTRRKSVKLLSSKHNNTRSTNEKRKEELRPFSG